MSRQTQAPEPDANLLNKPGIIVPKPGLLSSCCFFTVLLLLGWAGAFGCFATAFEIPVDWALLAPLSVLFALIGTVQFLFERRRWIAPLCTLLMWGYALWRFFEEVVQGALYTANIMLSAYSERLNVRKVLPQFPVQELSISEQKHVITVFSVFLMFLFFWLLGSLLVRHQSVLGAFALTGLFLLSHLGFSIVPGSRAFGLLLVFWAFLLFMAPSLQQRRQLVEDGNSFRSSGDMFLHPVSLTLLPILALSLLLLYHVSPPETYERPQFFTDLRTQLYQDLNLQTLFRGDTGHKDQVNFSALGNRFYTGRIAMQVKHEWQNGVPPYSDTPVSQKDYLKEFVGSVYTGTSWEQLSGEDARTVNRIWGSQNAQTLSADLMQSMPMSTDPHYSYLVSVRKLNGNTQSVYSPYGLYSPLGPPNSMTYVSDGFLAVSSSLSGIDEYVLSAVATPALDNLPSYKDRVSAYLEHLAEISPFVTSANSEQYAKRIKKSMLKSRDGDQWQMTSWMRELLPAETLSGVIDPLEEYNKFVYSHYTQIPDSLRAVLEQYAAEHGLQPELAEEDRIAYLQQVKQVLARECAYSWTPPVVPDNTDFVTYFLTEGRSGYCVHFATAATMLLRAAGIPARYAEGYAVPTELPADSDLADGSGWNDVPDYNAHAWVEVYWGGIGWLPVEMTPAGDSVPAAYANAASPSEGDSLINSLPILTPTPATVLDPSENAIVRPSFPPRRDDLASLLEGNGRPSPSPSPSPSSPPENRTQNDKSPSTGLSVFNLWILMILLVLVPILLIWAQRLIRLLLRKRSFRQKDRNKAALCVYAHLRRLYWENRLLPHGSSTPPEELEELALRARFSNHTLTEEELARLIEQASAMEQKLKAGLPRGEWLRCKYLRILF